MKTQTKPKSKFRGFYTALALSLVMIGAACVFAYRQTSQTLEQNLNSLSEQMEVTTTATLPYEAPVVGVQTDVAMETETTVTATSATEETAAPETEPEETPMHQLTPPLSDFSILNPFSDGELVKSETTGTWQTHNGVDLSCAAGSDVFAIDTGTVSEVCSDALWGYTVTIDHDNGITSRYCGLDGNRTKAGRDRRKSRPGKCSRTASAPGSEKRRRLCRPDSILWITTKRDDVSTVPFTYIMTLVQHALPADTSRSESHRDTFSLPLASVSAH